VTAGLLPLLGVQPILGRVFSEEEADRSEKYSTAISYEFWQRHFAGDLKVLGRTFFVDNSPTFVGAVLPRGFNLFGSNAPDVYNPISVNSAGASATDRWLMGFGRLKPGITIEQRRRPWMFSPGTWNRLIPT
jgi:hypothetical protein